MLHSVSSARRIFMRISIFFLFIPISNQVISQDLPPAYALTNVTVHRVGQAPISSGTLVWRDGVIQEMGIDVSIPFDAFTIDGGDSLHVYPGFIDALNTWGSPAEEWSDEPKTTPGMPTYVRAGIRPERRASETHVRTSTEYINALKNGFTSGNLVPKGRMLPGRVEFFLLDEELEASNLYRSGGRLFQLEGAGGGWTDRAYPSTDMAVIAKLRQLFYEAIALREHLQFSQNRTGASLPVPDHDPVLLSLISILSGEEPLYFYLKQAEDLDRFFTLQDEFGFKAVLVTGENISEWAPEILRRDIPVLSTFFVPKKSDWMKNETRYSTDIQTDTLKNEGKEDELPETRPQWKIEEERLFQMRQKQAWLTHVNSLSVLKNSGVQLGFAGYGTSLKDWRENLLLLLEHGNLSAEELLFMMTQSNATILGVGDRLGTLSEGGIASFSVFSDEFTADKSKVIMTVAKGDVMEWKE